MDKIAIIGAGAFGYAMSWLAGNKHTDKEVALYDVNKEWIEFIDKERTHLIFHKGASLSKHILCTTDIEKTVSNADLIILAVPSKFLRQAIIDMKPFIKNDAILLNLAKGLEVETDKRASEIIIEELGNKHHVGSLSGGMIAREVTKGFPLCTDVAFDDIKTAREVCRFLTTDSLRLDKSDDLVGLEYAGALKNVVAIGAGIFDGAGFRESSKSAYVSYMAKEAKFLAMALGAKEETFSSGSQAWLGDLMTTCFGASRNLEFGSLLGQGYKARDAIAIMTKEKKSVEGYLTIKVAKDLAQEHNVETPLLDKLHEVVHQGVPAKQFVTYIIDHW